MIIEKLEKLCVENNTSLTALCKEITGSSGNLPTWKKDNIKPDWLRAICLKFKISSDFLLEIPKANKSITLSNEEGQVLKRFNRLNSDNKIKAQSYMIALHEKQKSEKTFSEELEDWVNVFDQSSVAADDDLKTGTDRLGK